ncbi:MAG TPA: glycosyltransferase [Bacteroidota bacterium]|nr:glycosyltransferase [Bacteroidota bacterium]
MSALVSVVVPTYNRRELLAKCLAAIRAQSYRNLEIIVVDDGSTDGTKDSLEMYGRDIRYISIAHSGFPGLVRNAGINVSRGEYVAFCDSDDVWLPDKTQIQLERLKDANRNFSCSDAYLAGEESRTVLRDYRFRYPSLNNCLLWENFVVTSSVIVERKLLSMSRLSDADARMFPVFQDYVLWLSLFDGLRMDLLQQPLLHYGLNPSSVSWEGRRRNPQLQLKILLTQPPFRKHPFIAAKKFLRYSRQLLAGTS